MAIGWNQAVGGFQGGRPAATRNQRKSACFVTFPPVHVRLSSLTERREEMAKGRTMSGWKA
jgi:hypothetical protein